MAGEIIKIDPKTMLPIISVEVLRDLYRRISALEAAQPETLTFPPIDLGMIGDPNDER